MATNPNGGSGGGKEKAVCERQQENISDGAAKGQAVDGMDKNPPAFRWRQGKNVPVNDHKNIATVLQRARLWMRMVQEPQRRRQG